MKDIILKTASEQIQKYGLRKFTMDEIAVELKMSKKTLYKYFPGKDIIIQEYFNEIIESDRIDTETNLKEAQSLLEQINSIVFSYHKYRLPVSIIEEAEKFYHDEWIKIQQLKDYKVALLKDCLQTAKNTGYLKKDVNLNMIGLLIDNSINTIFSYEFLSKNHVTVKEAVNEVLKILLYGIMK